MDIKSKRSLPYSLRCKIAALVVIIAAVVAAFFGEMYLIDNQSNWGGSPLNYNDYTDTKDYRNQLSRLIYDTVNVNLLYRSEDNIKAGNALDLDLVLKGFFAQNSFDDKTEEALREILTVRSAKLYYSMNNNAFFEMNAQDTSDYQKYIDAFEEYREYAINAQLNDYKQAKTRISKYVNFAYFLKSNSGDVDYYNDSLKNITIQSKYTIMDGSYVNGTYLSTIGYDYNNFAGGAEEILSENDYVMYAAAMMPFSQGDQFYEGWQYFEQQKATLPLAIGTVIISSSVVVALFIYLIYVSGRSEKGGEVSLIAIDRIYTDVHTGIVLVLAVVSVYGGAYLGYEITNMSDSGGAWIVIAKTILCALIIADVMVGLSYLLSMARQIKARQIFSNSLISHGIRKLGVLVTRKFFKGWFLLVVCAYWFVNIFIMRFVGGHVDGTVLLAALIFNVFCMVLSYKCLASLTKIMQAAKEISNGNINYELNLNEISPTFLNFARDVSGIQKGFRSAVFEAVKGERMRTDLITNVSHDLKTPLTSIITYVDLLKNAGPFNETAEGYIKVLDEKTIRLKQLVEDLIEASKVSSGNIKVNKDKVDLCQLLMQAVGEYEEKIEGAHLSVRFDFRDEVKISADGKHMWRIVDNLLSNAIKYSMANTRVYMTVFKEEDFGTLVVKNISAAPVEVFPEHLTERFIRGDESRTTEGSGLGLSIAKSLTEIQGGQFSIELDGDLFKAKVRMPLVKEI